MSNSENLKEESVWDYPRPPRLERTRQRLRVVHRGKRVEFENFLNGAWCYPETEGLYKPISGYFSFYGSKFDEAYVGNEKIIPQEGDFYGGWITKNLKGPFKGAPGTRFW
ncbi:hypothetical protein Gasu2_29910 [Galdieria sulphuraria]|nr:hypothetical protein Gasu2_29910 [Galdieria sulphuraria]